MAKWRFSDKVVTFAVSRRAHGMKWDAIRDGIREEFKITPPTERRMRDWVKLYEQIQTQKTARFVSVKVPKRIMAVYAKTRDTSMLMDVSERMVNAIYDAWRHKKNPMTTWALEMMRRIRRITGDKAFDEAIELIRRESDNTTESFRQNKTRGAT
jgi:hypothetical protein